MKRILIFFAVLLIRVCVFSSNDSTKMHVRIEVQLRTGYYNSLCVNDPPREFMGNYTQLSGIQLSAGGGISLDWRWFSVGLTVSMIPRINVNEDYQSTFGLGVMGNFDLATWNSSVPLGFRIFGGILPLGFVPTGSNEDKSTSAAYTIGFAPIVRLNKRTCRTTFLLAPAADFTFGQYWNREATGGSNYHGKYTVHYRYEYNSISVSLMLIVKFRTPQHRMKQQGPREIHSPAPPFPPFFPRR